MAADLDETSVDFKALLDDDSFDHELYQCLLDVAVNRLDSQSREVSIDELLVYVQGLFSIPQQTHTKAVKKAYKNSFSSLCNLRAEVQKAENLAIKDVDGSSDPYCMIAIVPNSSFTDLKLSKLPKKETKVIDSNLNPEWNETVEITTTRQRVKDSYFQIQVWDSDKVNPSKKVKGVKGVRRKVKEVAQSVTTKADTEDDFMGFNSVPLTNIPSDGLETWFKLRSANAFQDVSGRLKVRLSLSSVRDKAESKYSYSDDVMYAGMLRKAVNQAHKLFMETQDDESDEDSWSGDLPLPAKILLHEIEEQFRLSGFPAAIARWEVYAALHIKFKRGIDIIFMEGLLNHLEDNRNFVDKYEGKMIFSVDMLCESIKLFLRKECGTIALHREIFKTTKSDYIIQLGSILLIFKKLKSMGLYHFLRTLEPTMPFDVRSDVIHALERGTTEYYMKLYEKYREESQEQQKFIEENEENKPHGGHEVQALTKFSEQLHRDLVFGKSAYHSVFLKILDIDYVSHVAAIVCKHISREASTTMERVNDIISNIKDSNENENKSSWLFRFYFAIKELADFAKTNENSQSIISGKPKNSPRRKMDSLRGDNEMMSYASPVSIHEFIDWFRPCLLRWQEISRSQTRTVLKKAVQVDKVKPVDNIVKYTSSAVDTIACLTGVTTFWVRLEWPDPIEEYTIALMLTNDMAGSIDIYADLLHKKLREVGFFDDEGQFDVTEELCLALNNLEKVKSFIGDIKKIMKFEKVANKVDLYGKSLTGERVMSNFNGLIHGANLSMQKKIHAITSVVGEKMKPDIRGYLRTFAREVTDDEKTADYQENHDPEIRKTLERTADKAIRPLMQYLYNNIISLKEWMCKPNFRRVLEVLWEKTVREFSKVALIDFVNQKAGFFYQCRYICNHHLRDFFYADGEGLSDNKLTKGKECWLMEEEFKMRSARTSDLLKLFYMQLFEEQQKYEANPTYGFLNVFAWYDLSSEEVKVDIISAENLLSLDINGKSDPFVQIKLEPSMLVKNSQTKETAVVKENVNPMWEDESFKFPIKQSLAKQEGMMLVFAVLDFDVLSANDLEGEAVLPLTMLDGLKELDNLEESPSKVQRHFRLTLTQPKKLVKGSRLRSCQSWDVNANMPKSRFSSYDLDESGLNYTSSLVVSPLLILSARRKYDESADEFYKSREKLEKFKEEHEAKRKK